jgi:hypothetical protein
MPSFPPETFDCYTLAVYVRQHCYNVPTPLAVEPDLINWANLSALVALHQERELYVRVSFPIASDIMIFNLSHIGVVVEGGVLSAVAAGAHKVLFFDWPKMERFFSDAYPVRLRS